MEEIGSPYAVFVVAFNEDGLVASTTRPYDKTNKIGLPGGKVEKFETPIDAVRRESYEEGWDIDISDD
jgi:8-oxo-dGTP pyrophosphatase MutT (NUDIX family)